MAGDALGVEEWLHISSIGHRSGTRTGGEPDCDRGHGEQGGGGDYREWAVMKSLVSH